jgi:hypothetical protein
MNVSNVQFVRFEVFTAVTLMIIIFWEMTPCGSYKKMIIIINVQFSRVRFSIGTAKFSVCVHGHLVRILALFFNFYMFL